MSSHILPSRGLAFGGYPQRAASDDASALRDALRALRSRLARRVAARLPRRVARSLATTRERLRVADAGTLAAETDAVRLRLRRDGLSGQAGGEALALVAEQAARTLGKSPYDTQLQAAWLMLTGHLVEMATGEGKTLAAALAAAVAALGGAPVHVLTANDYLVRRDCDALAPLYAALGLSSACVLGGMPRAARERAWQHDIVYATAKELVFDYLRDHLSLEGERDARVLRARAIAADDAGDASASAATPLLPGLCFGIVDEADSIVLDEACVPLILAAPCSPIDAGAYRRAYEISCTLQRQRDYQLPHARRAVALTDAGRARVAAAVNDADTALAPARRACELVEAALAARLSYRRDRDYAVAADGLKLIDELTGRIAEGRQWSGALHPMVELKEGLEPGTPTATAAQITYQRFFPRYSRLGGMSGTLLEARHELHVLYGAPVVRVPLARRDRRRWLGERFFVDAAHKWHAVLQSVRAHAAAGRPVLIGTDSVASSAQLSALLHAAGVAHQLLNALQDAGEADLISRAGRHGVVTVATNIAGRGTDIRLDADAAAAGGLHVIATMRNRARRIDRQLIGRSARHGDPGSAEALIALDDPLVVDAWPRALLRAAAACARDGCVPALLARTLFTTAQRLAEWRDRALRRQLRGAAARTGELYGFAGGTE